MTAEQTDRTEEVQQLTVRLPRDLHDALKTLSMATGRSINDLVQGAVRDYLTDDGHREAVETFFVEAREQYRVALDKLADL
jgi:predicted transcriptional regulator